MKRLALYVVFLPLAALGAVTCVKVVHLVRTFNRIFGTMTPDQADRAMREHGEL